MGTHVAPIREFLTEHNEFKHQDELFFPSLAFNPHLGLPGACLDAPTPPSETKIGYLARYVIWLDTGIRCQTKYVREVCILGTPNVPGLQKVPHLIANKFHADYHPEAYNLMEKWYFGKIAVELKTGHYAEDAFNPVVYANRLCSHRHL